MSESLIDAVQKGSLGKAMQLIKEGANVNETDKYYGWTPLHIAAREGKTGLTKVLIKHQAMVDARDCVGQTPLHRAAFWGHIDICKLLVDAGGDFTALDNLLQTPEELARIHGHMDVSGYFQQCCILLEFGGHTGRYSAEKVDIMNKQLKRKEQEEKKRKELKMELERHGALADKHREKIRVLEEKIEEKKEMLLEKAERYKKEITQLTSSLSAPTSPLKSHYQEGLTDNSLSKTHSSSSLSLFSKNNAVLPDFPFANLTKKEVARLRELQRKLSKIQHQLDEYKLQLSNARRRSIQHVQTEYRGEVWLNFINLP